MKASSGSASFAPPASMSVSSVCTLAMLVENDVAAAALTAPNPTSGTLHMRLHDPFPEADLEVRDITGRLVLAPGRALSTHAFDVSILAAGTYLLVDRTGTFAGQRFVKEWGVPETSSEVQDPR